MKTIKIFFLSSLLILVLNYTSKAQNPHYSDYWKNLSGELNQNQEADIVPEIIIEGNTIHVIWLEYKSSVTANLWYCHSNDLGITWDEAQKLFEFDDKSGNLGMINAFSKIMSVNGSTVNLSFSDYFYYENGIGKLYFIQSNDGGNTFSSPIVLDDTGGGYKKITRTQICNFGNKIVIAYEKATTNMGNYNIKLNFSEDNGISFTDTIIVPASENHTLRNLNYEGDNFIVLTQFTGGSYAYPQKVFATVVSEDFENINTSKISVVIEGREEANIDTQDVDDFEYRPAIAKIDNNIHIVFRNKTQIEGEGTKYYVSYVRSVDNGNSFEEQRHIAEAYNPSPVVLAKNNNVYIGFRDNEKFRLISSTDGGNTFGEVNTSLDSVLGGLSTVSKKFNMFLDPLDETGSKLYVVGNNHSLAKFTENGTKLSEFTGFTIPVSYNDLKTSVVIDNQGIKHWFMQYKPKNGTDLDLYYHHQGREAEPSETNKVFEASKLEGQSFPPMLIVPHSESLEFTNKISVELMLKLNPDFSSPSDAHLLFTSNSSKYYYYNSVSGYQIGYRRNSNNEFSINTGINTELGDFYSTTSYFLKDTLWHHIVFTYDEDAETNNFITYVDGIIKAKQTVTGKIDAGQGMIHLGLQNSFTSDYYNRFCQIDNVRVWDKALSGNEIRENLARTDFSNEENLKLFLNFNDSFKDISGNNNDAVPINNVKTAETIFDPPTANFEMYKNLNTLSFINKTIKGNSYLWDFGNTATSNLDNPIYQYSNPGEYDIYLLAKNENSVSSCMQHASIEGLDRIYPTKTGNIGQIILDIYGGSLTSENTQLILRKEGQEDIIAHEFSLKNEGNLQANFKLDNVAIGKWDVVVVKDGLESSLAEALDIEEVNYGKNWAKIYGRGFIMPNKWQTFQISYGNTSNVDSYSVPLWLCIAEESLLDIAFLDFEIVSPDNFETLPDFETLNAFDDYFITDSVNGKEMQARVYPILIPVVRANSTNTISLRFKASDKLDIATYVDKAWLSAENMMESEAKVSIGEAAGCVTELLGRGIIDAATNTIPLAGCVWQGMQASYDTYQYAVNGKGSFWGTAKNVGFNALNCGTSLLGDLAFPVKWGLAVINFVNTAYDMKNCWEPRDENKRRLLTIEAMDPNEMVGPSGYDDVNWIQTMEKIPYTIYFENMSTATAPAHDVFITDTLDANVFDFSYFSFGDFGWGGKFFQQEQEGAREFSQDIDLRPEIELILRVAGKFEEESGAVHFEFISLNPETMAEEEDALIGFLPPNGEFGEGEGFVEFVVGVKPDLSTGTEIQNKASIIFDTNAAIETNEYINTIDDEIPESSVHSVNLLDDDSLLISWEGFDQGSGIAEYSVFMQFNDEEIRPLKLITTETSTIFKPSESGTYKFYSIASDNAYNKENEFKDFDLTYDFNGSKTYKAENNSIQISPNPANDFVFIKLENKEWRGTYNLELIRNDGKIFMSKTLKSENLNEGYKLDIKDLSSGIYMIRVFDSENYYLDKIVVE
ncbi:MAG: PKD domain protein [Bacteroidetes bacterium ADurb.Bin028]|nr:MAG: PKD domain protein [Bacteroidetes bacterium ADurb.Bin028]